MEGIKLSFYVVQFLQFLRVYKQFLQQFLQFLLFLGIYRAYDKEDFMHCTEMLSHRHSTHPPGEMWHRGAIIGRGLLLSRRAPKRQPQGKPPPSDAGAAAPQIPGEKNAHVLRMLACMYGCMHTQALDKFHTVLNCECWRM